MGGQGKEWGVVLRGVGVSAIKADKKRKPGGCGNRGRFRQDGIFSVISKPDWDPLKQEDSSSEGNNLHFYRSRIGRTERKGKGKLCSATNRIRLEKLLYWEQHSLSYHQRMEHQRLKKSRLSEHSPQDREDTDSPTSMGISELGNYYNMYRVLVCEHVCMGHDQDDKKQ
ncbi:uncharacterized [Tachysurus ichikawai]